MSAIKCRYIEVNGVECWLVTHWLGTCGKRSRHFAELMIVESDGVDDRPGGKLADHPSSEWPSTCSRCVAKAPGDATHSMSHRKRYNTSSGAPEPGDMFLTSYLHDRVDGRSKCIYWDNCTESHLFVILPNGYHWDVDSRASNCTMPMDKLHRCWVRHGEPPNVHVDKVGNTCKSGGSIGAPGYHGFLDHGYLTTQRGKHT